MKKRRNTFMGQYVKSKKYMIRPSKKKEVIEFIKDNFKGTKYQTLWIFITYYIIRKSHLLISQL